MLEIREIEKRWCNTLARIFVTFTLYLKQKYFTTMFCNTSISPRIILVPIVPDQYFRLIGRISAKQSGTCGQSRAITREGLERSGAIASVLRESGTEKLIGYCFKTCSKTVADQNPSAASRLGRPRVLWRSSCLACPLELSCTLWSSPLPSGAFVYPPQLSLPVIVRKVSKRIDIS